MKSFRKARLLEDFKELLEDYNEGVETALQNLEEADIDDPYLDEYELKYVENSEFIFDHE